MPRPRTIGRKIGLKLEKPSTSELGLDASQGKRKRSEGNDDDDNDSPHGMILDKEILHNQPFATDFVSSLILN